MVAYVRIYIRATDGGLNPRYSHTRVHIHMQHTHIYNTYTHTLRDKGETRNAIIIIMPDRYNTRCSLVASASEDADDMKARRNARVTTTTLRCWHQEITKLLVSTSCLFHPSSHLPAILPPVCDIRH